jgi:hypothetical protein
LTVVVVVAVVVGVAATSAKKGSSQFDLMIILVHFCQAPSSVMAQKKINRRPFKKALKNPRLTHRPIISGTADFCPTIFIVVAADPIQGPNMTISEGKRGQAQRWEKAWFPGQD